MTMEFHMRKAHLDDVHGIYGLLMAEANKGLLLARPLSQVYSCLRDFFVLENNEGSLVGCCALALAWERMAEVRSLAVSETYRKRGLGKKLVQACMDDAVTFGVTQVFTLTYQDGFFGSLGFTVVPKETLPQKIWTDCINCPKFPNCDEIAMIRNA